MNSEIKLRNRILAYLLDILLVYIVISFVVSIRFINPYYDKYLESYDKYNEILNDVTGDINDDIDINKLVVKVKDIFYDINKYGVAYNIASCLILILYFVVFQKFNNGQTLGKKIMKIKVVDNKTEENPGLLKYLLRLLPLQFIYIGGFLPMLLNSILVLILNSTLYMYGFSAISFIFMLINIINFFLILLKKDKRGLHDLIAGTKVVNE